MACSRWADCDQHKRGGVESTGTHRNWLAGRYSMDGTSLSFAVRSHHAGAHKLGITRWHGLRGFAHRPCRRILHLLGPVADDALLAVNNRRCHWLFGHFGFDPHNFAPERVHPMAQVMGDGLLVDRVFHLLSDPCAGTRASAGRKLFRTYNFDRHDDSIIRETTWANLSSLCQICDFASANKQLSQVRRFKGRSSVRRNGRL